MDDAFKIHYPPFSYERVGEGFRIRDARDNPVARTYLEENAELICKALNEYYERR